MTMNRLGRRRATKVRRDLTPQELMELQELHRAVGSKQWEAAQIKANTALVPDGQKLAEQTEAVARLLENVKNQWVAGKLEECGYTKGTRCGLNLATGQIKVETTL